MRQALKSALRARNPFNEHWVSALLRSEAMWDHLGVYPPFLFFGIEFAWEKAAHRLTVTVPLRWYFRNNSGVMFGAAMAVASDPFPALMYQRLVPGSVAWTRSHRIQYLRPVTGPVRFSLDVGETEVNDLQQQLKQRGRVSRDHDFFFYDEAGRRVAKVSSTAHLALPRTEGLG